MVRTKNSTTITSISRVAGRTVPPVAATAPGTPCNASCRSIGAGWVEVVLRSEGERLPPHTRDQVCLATEFLGELMEPDGAAPGGEA